MVVQIMLSVPKVALGPRRAALTSLPISWVCGAAGQAPGSWFEGDVNSRSLVTLTSPLGKSVLAGVKFPPIPMGSAQLDA